MLPNNFPPKNTRFTHSQDVYLKTVVHMIMKMLIAGYTMSAQFKGCRTESLKLRDSQVNGFSMLCLHNSNKQVASYQVCCQQLSLWRAGKSCLAAKTGLQTKHTSSSEFPPNSKQPREYLANCMPDLRPSLDSLGDSLLISSGSHKS